MIYELSGLGVDLDGRPVLRDLSFSIRAGERVVVLGVNALAMGLLGPGAAWLVYRALRRNWPRAAAFAGAYVGIQVATLGVSLVLGLQNRLDGDYMPVPFPVMLPAMMLPSLTVVGVVEGLYTVATLSLLRRARLLDAP